MAVTTAEGEVPTPRGTTPTPTTARITKRIKFTAAKLPPTTHLVLAKSLQIATPLKEVTLVGVLFEQRGLVALAQVRHHVVFSAEGYTCIGGISSREYPYA